MNTLIDGPLAQTAGDGLLSLREAVTAASQNRSVDGSPAGQNNAEDTITFASGLNGTITLSAGALDLSGGPISLQGPGADKLSIQGDNNRLFFVFTTTTISDLTLTRGRSNSGGAILNSSQLAIRRSVLSDNVSSETGGAIYSTGTLQIVDSTLSNNSADFGGGGIHNLGSTTIVNSTLFGNTVLAGRPSGTQSNVTIQTNIQGSVNNRVAIDKVSQVFYEGLASTNYAMPNQSGAVPVAVTNVGLLMRTTTDTEFTSENFSAVVSVDVVVTDVETGESDTIFLDDTVIGNVFYNQGSVSGYGLTVRQEPKNTVTVGGRTYSLDPPGAALNSDSPTGTSDQAQVLAQLRVSDPPPRAKHGGAITNEGDLFIRNSTIAGNISVDEGGGIYNVELSNAQLQMTNTLVAGNRNPAGVANDFGGTTVDLPSTFNLLGSAGTSGLTNNVQNNIVGVDFRNVLENDGTKALLKNNGGSTPTIALLANSPAIDRGETSFDANNLPNDQRGSGFSRVRDGNQDGTARIDIGAFESVAVLYDYGDAPTAAQSGFAASYPVTLAQNGARHTKSTLFLGSSIDDEADGQPSNLATADGADDDEGIELLTSVLSGSTINVASLSIISSGTGKLDAWIDWNRDGDWNDTAEKVIDGSAVQTGNNVVSFQVPAQLSAGNVYARFRLSSSGTPSPIGEAIDGEVADKMISLLASNSVTLATLSQTGMGPLRLSTDSNSLRVTQNGVIRFRAEFNDSPAFELSGTPEDDILIIDQATNLPLQNLTAKGGAGFDTIRLADSGYSLLLALAPSALTGFERIELNGNGINNLNLDALSVGNLASTVQLQYGPDDTVQFGLGWRVEAPQFVTNQFMHVLKQNDLTLLVDNGRPYHNPLSSLDINRSGSISPLDALLIINAINSQITLTNPTVTDLNNLAFIDSNGDGSLSPLDALLVINALNAQAGGSGEGPAVPSELAPDVAIRKRAHDLWFGDWEG